MNIINIIEEIEKVDGEIYERLSPRRSAMKDFYDMGKKITLAAMPLALGSLFNKAYGQNTPTDVTGVLNFALGLEYLEYHFYNHAVANASAVGLSGAALTAITVIRDHEKAHVDLLVGALGNSAIPAKAYTDFDYTAKGNFPLVFSDYATFLAVAQAFEDTGVRAYKGQAKVLMGSSSVLQTALQIHSVEARHAAHIRSMRAANGFAIKPWISLGPGGIANDSGVAAAAAVYAGENNVVQAGITITGINGNAGITTAAAAECFDEPLGAADVAAIAGLFNK